MDLIDRQSAIDKFEPWLKVEGYSEGELNALKAVLYELRVMPPAQPERKTGHWITLDSDSEIYEDIKCPFCGHTFTVDVERMCDIGFIKDDLKYCPNCGAKME